MNRQPADTCLQVGMPTGASADEINFGRKLEPRRAFRAQRSIAHIRTLSLRSTRLRALSVACAALEQGDFTQLVFDLPRFNDPQFLHPELYRGSIHSQTRRRSIRAGDHPFRLL